MFAGRYSYKPKALAMGDFIAALQQAGRPTRADRYF